MSIPVLVVVFPVNPFLAGSSRFGFGFGSSVINTQLWVQAFWVWNRIFGGFCVSVQPRTVYSKLIEKGRETNKLKAIFPQTCRQNLLGQETACREQN